jgi:glutamate dehydrogenase (NAD(P)+)
MNYSGRKSSVKPCEIQQSDFPLADELGPLKIIHVYDPSVNLKGILVVDNVATGPAIGGLRLAPDVSLDECFRLARAMTLKNAAAGLAHGGGKSVLIGDPDMPIEEKEQLIRAFACALKGETDYIFGPDMGTNEQCMAWVQDEIDRCVGLPADLGGIPLDELGATAYGLMVAARVAEDYVDFKLMGARLVVQGFGAVGKNAARFFRDLGVILVGAADIDGTIYNGDGLDVDKLIELSESGHGVSEYADAEHLGTADVVDLDCDIWIPAARPDVLNAANIDGFKAKLILQGANIPATLEAEQLLHDRGVLSVPDIIANAGGVICASVEYSGLTQAAAFDAIEEKITLNTLKVLRQVSETGVLPRQAANDLAMKRVKSAMSTRRWSLF